ncbi:FtsW/RodA/SpoVE family cell cycle protein [Polymorphospora rubra]|uniref:Probable peptidoglycan glycosyltransferase FtsW n=1 Tax=Polymorphospora rubra TaxID=338584 RepID=A0A810MVB3_9ACTN|nr:putative peptidoglycan glycosyltransferase FtsW [Polymorphospora rubra]BCJ63365.1 putative lipid II flippase FtsW [Polymorphospora rubra]
MTGERPPDGDEAVPAVDRAGPPRAGQPGGSPGAGQPAAGPERAGQPAGGPRRAGPPAGPPGRGVDLSGGLAALRGLLARPLASYYLLLSSAGLLLVIGLTMVYSATSIRSFADVGSATATFADQAVFALIGLVAFWVCQRLPARTFQALAIPVLGVALTLLVILDALLALAALGLLEESILGPLEADRLWLFIGPVGLQPSEVAKFGMVLWGSDVIARKGAALGWWRELAMPLFPVVGLLFVLVGYNDLGTMLCLLAVVVGLLWAAGVRLRIFATLSVLGLAGVGLLIAAASQGGGSDGEGGNYRLDRLTLFFNPPDDCSLDLCYQMIQSRNALDTGGWFGVGLGKGSLKWEWLPAADNDFIFAILANELGVVGCFVVLALFGVLAYSGMRIARRVEGDFRRLAAASATTWLISQALINIGGVVGLIPLTGVPLPFISRGGSALLVTLAAIGMLASFARAEPDAARALHARPPARWVRLLWAPLPPLPAGRRADRSSAPTARSTGSGARRGADPGATKRRDGDARPKQGGTARPRAGSGSERRR